MTKSIFGWSYPPGCSGPPDGDDCISPESEEVCLLLESASVDQSVIDKVTAIVDELAVRAVAECSRCRAAADKHEAETEAAAEAYWASAAYPIIESQPCPHGNTNECDACLVAGDFAYDAACEARYV